MRCTWRNRGGEWENELGTLSAHGGACDFVWLLDFWVLLTGPQVHTSWIVGGVLSQFTGNKLQFGSALFMNGKPVIPKFLHWKGEQFGCFSLFFFNWVKQREVWKNKENKQRDRNHPKIPDSVAKAKITTKNLFTLNYNNVVVQLLLSSLFMVCGFTD